MLDSNDWYAATVFALDAISLAGAATAGAATIRMVFIARSANPSRTVLDILRGLKRHERKRLTEEIIRTQNPGISNGQFKALVRAGVYPKRYTGIELGAGVRRQLTDALGAAFSFAGSASGGLVRRYAVGIAESLD